ncbi:IS630 family transposase [Nostoc sp. PA-18-2419]|uniref:IS630 family transposase n=1 Tax=Nostoc sp. PA-18-2419 TaxID=2575443 RepID=UPI001109E47A|nr:IS630 family transposase [Nostoc sp. PA-18-2419]
MLGNGKRLHYLCQDETRIGLKTETGRVITPGGVKPKVSVQWPREAFWLYGVVEPFVGWQFYQEYDHLNSETFQKFLDALSLELGKDMALIQMEQACAHQALALIWPDNLIPIFQPAHSPQLNPIERLWQHIKRQWKGENFSSLQQLRQRVQLELAQMSSQLISSLTSYDFILEALFHEALFYAAS